MQKFGSVINDFFFCRKITIFTHVRILSPEVRTLKPSEANLVVKHFEGERTLVLPWQGGD